MRKIYLNFIALFFLLFGFFFNFLFLYFFLAIIFFFLFIKNKIYIYFLISTIFITFFLFEIFFKENIKDSDYLIENNLQYSIDVDYGYHPVINTIFYEKVFFKKNIIKENMYSINQYGHRKLKNSENIDNCILFHGGSITFGQSLSDEENLPYFTNQLLKKDYNVYNYAFNGYGPHQFLSKMRNLKYKEIEKCNNLIVIYQFIYDHIARVVGKRSWGDKSPRFKIEKNKLIQKGFFSNFPFKIIMKIRKNFRHSKVSNLIYNLDNISYKDITIFLSILKNIEFEAKNHFKNVNFIYLVWDTNLDEKSNITQFFESRNSIFIEDLNIDKNYKNNNIPGDNHPTKEYNVILSKEIQSFLIKKNLF